MSVIMKNVKFLYSLIFLSLIFASCFKESKSSLNEFTYTAYYFHPTARCESCINIENFTKELIDTKYSSLPVSINFISLNIDEQENEHFKKDYSLNFSSVLISKQKNGAEVKFKNLDSIWTYSNNRDGFNNYLNSEIQGFIK